MRFGSVCSGIEAASTAWNPIGWEAAWFAEIEPFPSAVLKHHYPDVPNYGDMTKFKDWNAESIDLLCGGTPCQSFSVAGLRKGLDDPRGNLMLTFGAIADHFRPKWLVWENVPGVLSSNGGRDFGSFLWMLGKLGYGFAYRVLDAQYFGVPQRRRRVFVAGCIGDWRSAAAVLFERDSLSGDPAPRRKTGQEVAGTISSRTTGGGGLGTDFDLAGGIQRWPAEVAPTLDAHYGDNMGLENQYINAGGGCSSLAMCLTTKVRIDAETETLIPTIGGRFSCDPIPIHDKATRHAGHSQDRANADGSGNGLGIGQEGDPMYTITTGDKHAVAQPIAFHHNAQACQLPTEGRDTSISDALTCSQQAAVAFSAKDHGADATVELSPTLRAMGHSGSHANGGGQMAVFLQDDMSAKTSVELAGTLRREAGGAGACVVAQMQVRRLTPVECERLQGFPDGYTNIPWRGKPESPDGPRYKALGNSWAVPCAKWIGERIMQAESIK